MKTRKISLMITALVLAGLMLISGLSQAQGKKAAAQTGKPNIIIIWGYDIGQSNLSCYTHGLMGHQTPNIDRLAKEGMMFTDYYGEQSCTAGRASFITGQCGLRTGLTKVGMPGALTGLQKEDPTIAELHKGQGYAMGQFGKNHLGDRDEFLPTIHGFDEFYGNLYHLNAEEEPELRDYPTEADIPGFREKFGPRGVLHSWANADGSQKIIDTGPLNRKRMETIDDTMVDHDKNVGMILDMIEKLGIGDNTIIMYSTDNGPHENSWPDAGTTPFRSEKNTNWEGAYRVPVLISWPGHIKAGS